MKRLAAGLVALLLGLTGCDTAPEHAETPSSPALWQVESADGEVEGWLFGTIHALPRGVNWTTSIIDHAFDESDILAVEVAEFDDTAAYAQLARTPGSGKLSARVSPRLRGELATMLNDAGLKDSSFYNVEDWAAAIALASLGRDADPANGVDRALLDRVGSFQGKGSMKQVVELEGLVPQLTIFDKLPAADQRALLDASVEGYSNSGERSAKMRQFWLAGDMDDLGEFIFDEIDDTPGLYKALLTDRNLLMSGKVAAMLAGPGKLFVAIGAGHMIGEDGLPALLEARGYRVHRIQ